MKSDKQLIREGNYQEALGDNYNYKPIYVMIFENRTIIDQLDQRFTTKIEAIEWLKNNKEPLKEGQEYYFGNLNHDWL
jgi:hypothetical protein